MRILINNKGQALINNDWNSGLDSLGKLVNLYYADHDDSDNYRQMEEISRKRCRTEIARLNQEINSNKNEDFDKIIVEMKKNWEDKLIYTELIGTYQTISKSRFFLIKMGSKTEMKYYFNVINIINKELSALRNKLSIEKFKKPYYQLNQLDSLDKIRKRAINEVYPIIINSPYYFEVEYMDFSQ
ncbi:hypothetical protein N9651_00785 [Flavobacteriales bacterium]|nr:hypothetical protein [Flavobacteriales bacterium]